MISQQDQEEYVEVREDGTIAYLIFHSKKGNSLSSSMLKCMTEYLVQLDRKDHVKVIVIKSIGKSFCAGASFKELLEIDSLVKGEAFFMGFANVIEAIKKTKAFVIVEIQGATVGGGVGIAAAGDYTIASEEAKFKLSELNIGIGPFVISAVLKERIGSAAFLKMAYSPLDFFDCNWANQNYLVSFSPSGKSLEAAVNDKAMEISKLNKEAIGLLKAQFYSPQLLKEMQLLAKLSGRLVCESHTKEYLNNFYHK